MKKATIAAVTAFLFPCAAAAQELSTTTWEAYGVNFKVPAGFIVEDDSEEGYTISTSTYYITVQLLEGDGIKKEELAAELKNIATDDQMAQQTPVESFELPQFYGAKIKGDCENDRCLYSYLLAKDGGSGFYVSIVYGGKDEQTPENILQSFRLEE